MYMGVIPKPVEPIVQALCAPHVYGGDPKILTRLDIGGVVLPMYMGVILDVDLHLDNLFCAPHVYGGDPVQQYFLNLLVRCSPCIWG